MNACVRPGIREVFGPEGWIAVQEISFGNSQAAVAFEEPDWDAGPNDAGVASANRGRGVDAGEVVIEVLDDPFEELGFLASGKGWEEFFDFLNWFHAVRSVSFSLFRRASGWRG